MKHGWMKPFLRTPASLVMLAALLLVAALTPAWSQMNWHADYFPNVTLLTQDGRKVRFYDDLLKDKVVVISFVYTSCPDVCPLDTAKLRQVQKLLGNRVGKDVFLYTITLDPKHDTPAVLKRYMAKYDIQPGWTFLTGRPQDIALVQRKLGITPVAPGQLGDHDTRFIFGNETTGQWLKRAADEQPKVLANLLDGFLQKPSLAARARRPSYASAGRIGSVSSAERLFRNRCASCHTIGGGDGLGPDLRGVTARRSPAWVAGWIKEPDRMIHAKNPAVAALVKRYRGLPMPKLGLSDADVTELVAFLEAGEKRSGVAGVDKQRP